MCHTRVCSILKNNPQVHIQENGIISNIYYKTVKLNMFSVYLLINQSSLYIYEYKLYMYFIIVTFGLTDYSGISFHISSEFQKTIHELQCDYPILQLTPLWILYISNFTNFCYLDGKATIHVFFCNGLIMFTYQVTAEIGLCLIKSTTKTKENSCQMVYKEFSFLQPSALF